MLQFCGVLSGCGDGLADPPLDAIPILPLRSLHRREHLAPVRTASAIDGAATSKGVCQAPLLGLGLCLSPCMLSAVIIADELEPLLLVALRPAWAWRGAAR